MTDQVKPDPADTLSRIFISHASEDQEFADSVQARLQAPDISSWIDSTRIRTGDDILVGMGEGLRTMDILVLLISYAALDSTLIKLEVDHAIWREIKEKQVIVLPFIIDETPIDSIRDNPNFWHLAQRHISYISQDASGTDRIVHDVRANLEKRSQHFVSPPAQGWHTDPVLEQLIKPVRLGDWKTAMDIAVFVLRETNDQGDNEYFQKLVTTLYHLGDGDMRWSVIQVIESIAMIAPWLFNHAIIARMANHADFTIRTVAANICMDFAQFAPDRVPLDIAFRLARYDEDWYVMAPANATLKALVRSMPGVLAFYYQGLHDKDPQAREHSANAIYQISQREPDLLDPDDLEREIPHLWRIGDEWAAKTMTKSLFNAKQVTRNEGYKYGL